MADDPRTLDLSTGGIPAARVIMPDGKTYPLRVVRPYAESAALEDRMLRLGQLIEAADGDSDQAIKDRVERHRLLEESVIDIVDCPPDLVRQLHPVGQTQVVRLYYELQREALDPTDDAAAPASSAAPSSSPPSTDTTAASSPSGSEPARE